MSDIVSTLFASIEELMQKKEQVIVAIDGDCASGKTTLAELVAQTFDCNIIQMDHFFLRPEQKTAVRLATVGGNIDHGRFVDEVLIPLKSGKHFSYQPFNCKTQAFGAPIFIEAKRLTVIEGSYSHHPAFSNYYDLKVVLSIPEDLQIERILKRNGHIMLENFKNIWIPMEKKYATTFELEKNSDLFFTYLDYL